MNSKLARAYAKVPQIACKGLCHESCGIIPLIGKERELANRVAPEHVEKLGIKGADLVIYDDEKRGCCPFLAEKRCSIYEERPFMCRVWGVVDGMPCPHGCQPEERMSKKRFDSLVAEVRRA